MVIKPAHIPQEGVSSGGGVTGRHLGGGRHMFLQLSCLQLLRTIKAAVPFVKFDTGQGKDSNMDKDTGPSLGLSVVPLPVCNELIAPAHLGALFRHRRLFM